MEVLQTEGSAYCTAVNAATLAIIDAGIAMRDYVCACTASLSPGGGDNATAPVVDVSGVEASLGGPELTVAVLPKSGEIVLLEMTQRFHLDQLGPVLDAAVSGCRRISAVLDKEVRRHVSRGALEMRRGGAN